MDNKTTRSHIKLSVKIPPLMHQIKSNIHAFLTKSTNLINEFTGKFHETQGIAKDFII